MAAVLAALIVALFCLSASIGLYRRMRKAEASDDLQKTKARFLIGSLGQRYQIKVADWGPDFTGKGDILPRWRWSVVDADHSVRMAFVPGYFEKVPEPKVFMLGNSPTMQEAYYAALMWIEQQEHPALIVDGQSL